MTIDHLVVTPHGAVASDADSGLAFPVEDLADAIVRVRYTATREQDATIDKDAIRRELLAAGASRVTIEPTITRDVRARDERMTQELSDLDGLALYCEAQGLDAGMAERMGARLRQWIAS